MYNHFDTRPAVDRRKEMTQRYDAQR